MFVGLLESVEWLLLAFSPKMFGGSWELRMVLFYSIDAGSVVGIC